MNGIWNSVKKNFNRRYLWLVETTPDWDFIKAFFRSPIFGVVALIPVLGFVAVQAGTLSDAFADNEVYSKHVAAFADRISDLYWGAYYYFAAYAVYLFSSSPMIKSTRHLDEFLDFARTKNSPRLTISLIFQAVRSDDIFGKSSKVTKEFVDCVRIWIKRVSDLSADGTAYTEETKYILGRIAGDLPKDPKIQADLMAFRDRLLDLAVKHHRNDPWIRELNENIGHIFYRENARKPNLSRLLCLFWIALGTLHIFGTVVANHIRISVA